MKNIIIVLFFTFLLTSYQSEKKIGIKGKVSNNSKVKYALFAHDITGIGISTVIDTINIDINGNFNFENKLLKSNSLLFFDEEKPVRLTIPNTINTKIEIDLDF